MLFTLDNKLYDVSAFASKHPGGEKILRKLAGSNIGSYMKGLERVSGLKHEHSPAAYEILSRYAVDHSIEVKVLQFILL